MSFRVDQIDHVELSVSNRNQAAEWYEKVLGLKVIPEYEFWAKDPHGPLMIGTQDAGTKLALFEGNPQGSQRNRGFHLVAFRVGADSFVQFVNRLQELQLVDNKGVTVTPDMIADHQIAFSIYFNDLYGNQLELTTYEYQSTQSLLQSDQMNG